jgi:DNA-binding SARP family transcriptional activator
VRVRFLGPFEVHAATGPIDVTSARQRCLLAALAMNVGRPVSVSRLIDAVWGESPPACTTACSHTSPAFAP